MTCRRTQMKKQQIIKAIGFCIISLAITSTSAAPSSSPMDLPSANNNRQLVQFSQKVVDPSEFAKKANPVKAESQEYWFSVNGSELKKGISVDVSGSDSLISLSPKAALHSKNKSMANITKASQNLALDLDLVEITLPNGATFKGENAMSFKADSKQLANTGFAKGTSAFKLDKSIKVKKFSLKTSQSVDDGQEYLINVLEKNSPFKLKMELHDQQIIAGEKLFAMVKMDNQGKRITLGKTKAQFVSPGGQIFPAGLSSDKSGALVFDKVVNLPFAKTAGLWELQISTRGQQADQTIRRNSKLAFAYQPKTAELNNSSEKLKVANSGLSYDVNVNVNHPGRYEVTGLLYLVDNAGSKKAIAIARSAKWVEPGSETIPLVFNNSLLPDLQKGQRFEIGQVGLNDQSRMSVLQ